MHEAVRLVAGGLGLVLLYDAYRLLRLIESEAAYDVTLPEGALPREFHAILITEIVLIVASLLYLYGGYVSSEAAILLSEAIFVLVMVLPIYIIRTWRGRL